MNSIPAGPANRACAGWKCRRKSARRCIMSAARSILATEGHCDWEDATAETFDKVGVPYHKFNQAEVSARFPQFDAASIGYALYEPQSGMVMAHRAVLAGVELFKRAGGTVRRGRVVTDCGRAASPGWQTAGGEPHRRGHGPVDGGHVSAHDQTDLPDRRDQRALYVDPGWQHRFRP